MYILKHSALDWFGLAVWCEVIYVGGIDHQLNMPPPAGGSGATASPVSPHTQDGNDLVGGPQGWGAPEG